MPDNLTPEQRSYAMSRVKGWDTGIERLLRSMLDKSGVKYVTYPKDLPGKPDIAFPNKKLAVFVDGDWWHGYRFPAWRNSISAFWQEKIAKTRARDQRNFRKLRRMGWTVIRLWQHELKKRPDECLNRVLQVLQFRSHNVIP
jgi:DNA mismatch endonuclease, patch repair protein